MADTDFVYGLADLPADKVHADGFANPVTNATKRHSANDDNRVFAALRGIRDAIDLRWLNVLAFANPGQGIPIDPTGVEDSTEGIQLAFDAAAGRTLYIPRGKYKVTSTLNISERSTHIVGDFANRNTESGTEISYTGTGPCIEIHTDSGNPWDTNEYNGKQDHKFENLAIIHGAPDSNLPSTGVGGSHFKAGAYGIWDWRGGGITMRDCWLQGFEANFVGIQSDINLFDGIVSLLSKWGIYIGPRSDQFTLRNLYTHSSDRAVVIDGATHVRIVDAQIVGNGTATVSPIEVRLGSSSVLIERAWLEHLQGYQGTDQISFVSVGEVNGYGAGGSIQSPGGAPNTNPVEGLAIERPFCFTANSGVATHTRFVATVGKCHRFSIVRPSTKVGNSLTNFDALVGIQAAHAPTNAETQIHISGASSGLTLADMFSNLGAGTPDISIDVDGPSGKMDYSSQRWSFRRVGAVAGADEIQISQENNSGEFWVIAPNHTGGQTERLRLARHMGTQANASAPASGTYVQGDWKRISDPPPGGYLVWCCVVGGTPGTWVKAGLVTKTVGFEVPDTFLAAKSVRLLNELAAPQLTVSVNDYNPTNFADAAVLVLTSSGAVNITGFAIGTADGRLLKVYNNGANNITLKHQDAASTAANRIIGRGNADVVLTPATGCEIYYSPSIDRWLVLGDTL